MSAFEPMIEFSIYVPDYRYRPGPDVRPLFTPSGLLEHFAERYGGATCIPAQGSYKSFAGSVIVEGMSIISVSVRPEICEDVREDFQRFALAVAEEYAQECVLITERPLAAAFITRTES